MDGATLAKKLGLKPGHRALLLSAPDGFAERLAPLPADIELTEAVDGAADGSFDFVHLFVRDKAAIDRWAPAAIAATKPDGRLWISYPKRGAKVATDITRDVGWEAVTEAGWDGVAQVAVDEVWSALRFKPVAAIKRRGAVRVGG